ncbi:uroporphyrinogen-III synthase [Hyphomicrobium methylovorum]|uniref:uroporphyrinogen-III synthase n=1 Tax=Hyphomicrobium methylovorum TaxID=84 RepID=UPI0015E72159|nr:uroporphyrinogen-III synthase [Hyphomicrobium methylovorum]MBA2126339.1 uroporphyrinogen-III synthase [Hyphomicrobium methylovorum]
MHVLITRPKEDGETLATRLEKLGFRTSLEPLVTITCEPIPASAIEDAVGLIVTSRNGLRAISTSPALSLATSLPIFVTGPGTAALARKFGFKDILEGAGTGADLVPMISAKSRSMPGPFVHLSGDVVAYDLAGALARKNVNVRRTIVYRTAVATELSEKTQAALSGGELDTVVLMSPRTAATWAGLAAPHATPSVLGGLTHACLSDAVADTLRGKLSEPKIAIADRPNLDAMVVLLKRLADRPEAG